MAIMKMTALTIVGPRGEMDAVARRLLLTGSFQRLPLDIFVTERALRSKINTAIENPYDELLTKVSSIWKTAGEPLPQPSQEPLTEDLTLEKARKVVSEASGRLVIWEKRRKTLIEEAELLAAAKIFTKALKGLRFDLREMSGATYAVTFFGRISAENLERLADSAEEAPIVISELLKSDSGSWVLAVTVSAYRDTAQKLLDAVNFKQYSISEIAKSVAGHAENGDSLPDPLPTIEKHIKNHERAITALDEAAKNMLRERRSEYEKLYSRLYTLQRVYDLCKGRGEINGMFALSGWIPEAALEDVRKKVEKEAPLTMLLVESSGEAAQKGARVPTLLKNNRFFRVFQEIVALYSLPSYGEIDPSPLVALTFTLFFGFMFGDVGHGLMILIGAHYMVRRGIMSAGIGAVLKVASVSSMVFGVLYGSIFGIEGIFPALWLSPMHDTNKLLTVAICIGIFMISLGMILNMIKQYTARDFGRLLFDSSGLAGLLLYWTLVTMAAAKLTGANISSKISALMVFTIMLALLAMIFKDFLADRILKQRTEEHSTVMNVFEILHCLLGFISNTASFVRLAAFALNHVGLSMAVIMLSDLVSDVPGGVVLRILVFIVGNLVIVCLEGLIVFIQTLRLEYYEFFSKFYGGGGSAFKPISWKR